MRWSRLVLLLLAVGFAFNAEATTARILKVLPHLLDLQGRHTLTPGLYERDAYQVFLRKNPDQCSGLRFDVQWKAKRVDWARLKLRVEIRGSKEAAPFVLDRAVERNHWYNRWTSLTLSGESYRKAGEVIAWRATLWDGDKLLAEQKSFLW